MSLEQRVAYWVDAGITKYTDMYTIQQRVAALREAGAVGDVIIATQHLPEVNFGSSKKDNEFSETLLSETYRAKGVGYTRADIIETLKAQGIDFSETARGGGATVLAPGQLVFYPIVDHKLLTSGSTDVTHYKRLLDQILYNVIQQWNVPNLEIANGPIQTTKGERERRDVWTTIDGHSYKIGSKGIQLGNKAAQGGFVIYAHQEGVEPFKHIHACGYRPEEVGVISIEQATGKKPNAKQIVERTKQELMKIFGYQKMIPIHLDQIARSEEFHVPA